MSMFRHLVMPSMRNMHMNAMQDRHKRYEIKDLDILRQDN